MTVATLNVVKTNTRHTIATWTFVKATSEDGAAPAIHTGGINPLSITHIAVGDVGSAVVTWEASNDGINYVLYDDWTGAGALQTCPVAPVYLRPVIAYADMLTSDTYQIVLAGSNIH